MAWSSRWLFLTIIVSFSLCLSPGDSEVSEFYPDTSGPPVLRFFWEGVWGSGNFVRVTPFGVWEGGGKWWEPAVEMQFYTKSRRDKVLAPAPGIVTMVDKEWASLSVRYGRNYGYTMHHIVGVPEEIQPGARVEYGDLLGYTEFNKRPHDGFVEGWWEIELIKKEGDRYRSIPPYPYFDGESKRKLDSILEWSDFGEGDCVRSWNPSNCNQSWIDWVGKPEWWASGSRLGYFESDEETVEDFLKDLNLTWLLDEDFSYNVVVGNQEDDRERGQEDELVYTEDVGVFDDSGENIDVKEDEKSFDEIMGYKTSSDAGEREFGGQTDDGVIGVFVLAGQSNMAGWGKTSELSAPLRSGPANMLFYGSNNERVLGGGRNFGPEVGFAHEISRNYPQKEFMIVKYAVSGTSMNLWSPREGKKPGLYRNLLAQISEATKGRDVEYLGFFWMQGEADSGDSNLSREYGMNLKNFVKGVRNDLDTPNLPFVYGQVNPPQRYRYAEDVRSAQEEAEKEIPHARMVHTDDLGRQAGDLHFDSRGLVELGERFAGEYVVMSG